MRDRCAECGSERIMNDVRLIDATYGAVLSLRAEMYTNPDALLFKGAEHGQVTATICADCGHTTLRTSNLEIMWEIYQKTNGR